MTTKATRNVKTYEGKKVDLDEVDAQIAREATDSMRLISSILGSRFSISETKPAAENRQAKKTA